MMCPDIYWGMLKRQRLEISKILAATLFYSKKYYVMKIQSGLSMIIFLLSSYNVYSQQIHFILPLPTQSSVILSGITPFDLADLTGDSLVLGYLQVSTQNNERQAVKTPMAKESWLKNVITANTLASFAQLAKPVLYVINDISVGRVATGNYARIKATVYAKGITGYQLLKLVDTFVTDRAANINSVDGLVNTAIAGTAGLLRGALVPNPAEPGKTRAEVIQLEQSKYDFIRNGTNPTGIYLSYQEYKAKSPAFVQLFVKSDTTTKTIEIKSFTLADSTLKTVKPWAVAIDNELYIYQGKKLYPVEAVGNNLVFSKFIDPTTRKTTAASGA